MKILCGITAGLAVLVSGSVGAIAADGPVTVRWQFLPNHQHVYKYEFSQRASAHSELDPNPITPADEDSASGGGQVTVSAEADRGIMRLHHQVRAATRLGREAHPAELAAGDMTASVPIRADGSVVTNDRPASANLESFVETMFPVPREPLSADAPVKQPMHIAAPGVGDLTGEAVFTYQGNLRTNGLDCVRYKVECSLRTAPPATPSENRGQGEFSAQINCLFVPMKGCFFATDSRALLAYSTRGGIQMRLDVTRRVQYQATERLP